MESCISTKLAINDELCTTDAFDCKGDATISVKSPFSFVEANIIEDAKQKKAVHCTGVGVQVLAVAAVKTKSMNTKLPYAPKANVRYERRVFHK